MICIKSKGQLSCVLYLSMEISSGNEVSGWTALTNVSTFMSHLQQRKQLSIFGQLDAWLDFMQYLIKVQIHKADESRLKGKKRKKELPQDLVRALKSLKNEELIYYYNTIVEQIINLIQNKLSPPSIENSNFLIIESYTRSYNLRIWKQKKLRFDRQNHIIYAQKDKKIKIYDLANYIVRRSNSSDYFCIVLEAINSVPLEKSKTVHIGFQYKNTYNLWFLSVQSSVRFKLWEKLGDILGKKTIIKELAGKEEKQTLTKSMNDIQTNIKSSFYSQNEQIQKARVQTQQKLITEGKEEYSLSNQSFDESSNYTRSLNTLVDEQSILQQLSPNEEAQLLQKSFTNKLLKQQLHMSLEELYFECQRQSQDLKRRKRKAKIHTILLQNYKLSRIQQNSSFTQLNDETSKIPNFSVGTHIYQNISNPLNFKLICVSSKKCKPQMVETVLEHVLSGKQSKSTQKIEIKCIVYSQNITVNMEQHPPYNKLYRPREFIYIRHLMANPKGDFFVIDRSIQQQMFKERGHFVRGHLLRVTKITFSNQRITVTTDFTMRYNGDLRIEQEVNHSKKYLHNLASFLQKILDVQQEKTTQIKFYDCSRLTEEQSLQAKQQEIHESFTNISFNKLQVKASEQQQLQFLPQLQLSMTKQISYYQIPRSNLNLSNSQLNEEALEDETLTKLQQTGTEQLNVRMTYSPPRKFNKEYLLPKLSFLENVEDYYDFKTEVVPPWTIGWQVNEQRGGLINKRKDPKQLKILKQVLQQASRLTLLGKSSSKISFPIDILAPQSNLQRMVKTLSYAPTLFQQNMQLSTLQKLKKTVIFSILTSLLSLNIQKPFTPLLGQTFQGQISSSCKAYGQQLSTDPQRSALLLFGKDYSIEALVQPILEIAVNNVHGQNKGVYKVKFAKEKTVSFTLASGELTGLVYGQRTFQLIGRSYFWVEDQNLFLELNFQANNPFTISSNHQSKSDYFQGSICEVTPDFIQKLKFDRTRTSQKDIIRKIQKVCGRWTKSIKFAQQDISLRNVVLYQMNNEVNALISDSTFREDINLLKLGKHELAQLKELQIVNLQRQDQSLRKIQTYQHNKQS